jgi:6-phosphogluconate dehydrogenase
MAGVKSVLNHTTNGIEYGGMQLTAEVVRRLREQLDLLLDPKDFRRLSLSKEEARRLLQLWCILQLPLSFLLDIEDALSAQTRMTRSLTVKVERGQCVVAEAIGHDCEK